jgi:hypothetical protein
MAFETNTLRKLLNGDVVKLLDLFHDQLLLVDLDDDGGVSSISTCKSELAESGFEFLRYVNCSRLHKIC